MAYIYNVELNNGNSTDNYLIEPRLYGTSSYSNGVYTVTLDNSFTYSTGVVISTKITTTNAASATLKVNSLEAKSIYYNNALIEASVLKLNHTYSFVYNGIAWELIGDIDTNTQRPIGTGATDAAAGNHGHGNISNGGTLSAANQAVVTDGSNKITTEDLSSSTPAASGTATAFVTGVTQNAKGKLTSITKANLPTASDSVAGITKLGATGGAATYGHTHGNIKNDGTIGTAGKKKLVIVDTDNAITTGAEMDSSTTNQWLNKTGNWSTPTAAQVGAATSDHNHDTTYLKLDGTNKMSGDIGLKVAHTGITNTANKRIYWETTDTTPILKGYITISSNGNMGIHSATGLYFRPGDTNGNISNTTGTIMTNAAFYPYSNKGLSLGIQSTNEWSAVYATAYYGSAANMTSLTGASSGNYGPSAAVSGTNGTTMNVPYIQVDANGRITSISNKVYTAVNTWRGIQDNLTSSSNTTESLSAKQGYLLANGSARDDTKLPLAGGIMTGNIRKYYASASSEPLITVTSNNQDIYLWQLGHGNTAETTLSNNGYKLLYKGTNSTTNNYLQLIARNANGAETIAVQIDEIGNVQLPSMNKGSATKPIYLNNGVITEGTAIGASAYHADNYFALSGHTHSYVPYGSANNDLNTMYNTGIYNNTSGQMTNGPTAYGYGELITFSYRKHTGNTIPDYATQIYAHYNANTTGNCLYFRTSSQNAWNTWQMIAHANAGTAVGNSTQPIYIDAKGAISAGTALKDLAYIAKGSGSTKFLREDGTWQTALTSHQSLSAYAPLNSPTFTGTPKSVTPTSTSDDTMIATKAYVDGYLAVANALVYKGVIAGAASGDNNAYGALTPAANCGDTYKVSAAGFINGLRVEVGDMLICTTDNTAAATASGDAIYTTIRNNWNIIQTSEGTVSSSSTSTTDNTIARWDSTSGRIIQSSGITINDNNILTLPTEEGKGYIYKNYTAASTTPAIVIGSNNQNTNIIRVYSSDITYKDTQAYGFNLRYIGTGSGVGNELRFYADNQTGTEVIAISMNQSGQVGIKNAANTNYSLYVNGATYINGATTINSNLDITAGTIYFGKSATNKAILAYNSNNTKFGIWYHEGDTDVMRFSASGNADSNTTADFAINALGAGILSNRNNRIPHTGNTTGTVGSADGPVYVDGGQIKACTTYANATVAVAGKATNDSDGNKISTTYLKLSSDDSQTVSGPVIFSRTTDVVLTGTDATQPALIVGGAYDAQHLELDGNEIQSKSNKTTANSLYINNLGGAVEIGNNSASYLKVVYNSDASSTSTGALQVIGGASIAKTLYIGTGANITGTTIIQTTAAPQLKICNTSTASGNNLQLQLIRGGTSASASFASWQVSIESGDIYFKSNYDANGSAAGTAFARTALQLVRNTGNAIITGNTQAKSFTVATNNTAESHLQFGRSTYNYVGMPAGSELVFVSGTTVGTEYGIRMKITNNPKVTGGYIYPGVTDKMSLGSSDLKWSNVYATTFYGALNGNASSATALKNQGRLTDANITRTTDGGVRFFLATSSMTSNKPSSDGHILHFHWDGAASNAWDSQLFISDGHAGKMQWRGHANATTWGTGWHTILDDSNTTAPSSVPTLNWNSETTVFTLNGTAVKIKAMAQPTCSDIGAATSDHTHEEYVQNKAGNTDVNTDYDTGIYNMTGNNATNTPKNYTYGQLLTMCYRKHRGNTKPDWASQIYLHSGSTDGSSSATVPGNVLYYRTSNANSWLGWRKTLHADADHNAVGNTTKPIYASANGSATECEYMLPIYYTAPDLSSTTIEPGIYTFIGTANPVHSTTEWGSLVSFGGSAANNKRYSAQMLISSASGADKPAHAYIRRLTDGSGWSDWSTVLDNKNTYVASSSTLALARNTETTLATINGTALKIKLPASDNTWRPIGTGASDAMAGNTNVNNVFQGTTTTGNWRKVLSSGNDYAAWNTAVGNDVNTVTYRAASVAIQPSTGTLRATVLRGGAITLTSGAIQYEGTKATNTMIQFLDNTVDSYGNGIKIGAGGLVVVGAGESASSLSVANDGTIKPGTETLFLLSDGVINAEAYADTIGNRIGFQVNTSGNIIPVKAETANSNKQNIGASDNVWATIYASTFDGSILKLHQGTAANPSLTGNSRIEFDYSGGQPVVISYTPNDSYRDPAGLKIMGGTGATPAWLEVEGQLISQDYTHFNSNRVIDATLVMGARGKKPTATTTDGTTTYSGAVNGTAILTLGNNKVSANSASGVDDNAQGYLRLYSSGSAYGELTAYTTSSKTHIHATNGISFPENTINIMFRPGSGSYYTHVSYQTSGNEALVSATQNAVTSFIFVNGESYANIASDRWTKLTGASGAGNAPGLQIKQNCVSIGELIPNGTTPSHKLNVKGDSYFNGHITIPHTAGSSQELKITYSTTIDYWWGVGTGNENHGMYDAKAAKWILSAGTANTWSFDGNAATATAFSSGTTVKLTGDTTGESSSSTKGWSVATTTKKVTPTDASSTNLNTLTDLTTAYYYAGGSNTATNGPVTAGTAFGLHMFRTAAGYVRQEFATNGGDKYYRTYGSSAWGDWVKYLSSANYTEYTVKKDGTGASGTWGISITGSSASCTGNAATATTWQTSRTLTIGNKGQSVNGGGNVSWALQDVLIRAGNEFNYTANGIEGLWFNYKTQTGTSATTKIIEYNFGNGQGSVTGVTLKAAAFSGNAASATKIAAKLAATTKTYLLGTATTITATAANVDITGDTGVYLTTTAGELSAVRHSYNVSGTEKAYTTYNSTDNSIDFIFL